MCNYYCRGYLIKLGPSTFKNLAMKQPLELKKFMYVNKQGRTLRNRSQHEYLKDDVREKLRPLASSS